MLKKNSMALVWLHSMASNPMRSSSGICPKVHLSCTRACKNKNNQCPTGSLSNQLVLLVIPELKPFLLHDALRTGPPGTDLEAAQGMFAWGKGSLTSIALSPLTHQLQLK